MYLRLKIKSNLYVDRCTDGHIDRVKTEREREIEIEKIEAEIENERGS